MTDLRTYPPGVPCWVDTEQPDVEAASQFYGALFGWTFDDAVPAEAPGTYLIAGLDGRPVAAIGPSSNGAAEWNNYVAVADADATAARVTSQGGSVDIEPADAGPGGRLAGCVDPGGARFRLWQPRARPGVQAANEAGAWNFSDLHTSDRAAAKQFYAAVFGWEFSDLGDSTFVRMPGYGDHLATTFDPEVRERQAAVGTPAGFEDAVAWLAQAADGQADHWGVTFAVADCEQSTALAVSLGATALTTERTAWTVASLIRDPQGAELVLSQFLG